MLSSPAHMLGEWLVLASMTWLVGAVAVPVITMSSPSAQPLRDVTRPLRRRHIAAAVALLAIGSIWCMVWPTREFQDGRVLLVGIMRLFLLAVIVLALWQGSGYLAVVFVAGFMLLLTQSLLSRSAAQADWLGPTITDWFHMVLSSLWLGGVAGFATVAVPAAVRDASLRPALYAALHRFSPLAMFAAVGLGLSGAIQATLFVDSFDALVSTPFGQALMAKIAIFFGLMAFGGYHQFVLMPRLRPLPNKAVAEVSMPRFALSMLGELGLSLALLIAVVILKTLGSL